MPLKENMLEGVGTANKYVYDCTFPFWFVIGSRITNAEEKENVLPASFALSQNYPNPFNPSTTIKFTIPNVETTRQAVSITLKVYDILGREVATLVNGEKSPGTYEVKFNAGNLGSGMYFYQLKTGNFSETKKMLLLK
jgi:hypothetical protein